MMRTYYFEFVDSDSDFHCTVGRGLVEAKEDAGEIRPEWAGLQCHQCSHCPLGAEAAYCPAALEMAKLVEHFSRHNSCEKVTLHAIMDTQKHSIVTDLQSALAFVFPAIIAASSCPYAALLRPAEMFCKPFPDIGDFFFFALSSNLIKTHFGKNGLRFSDESDSIYSDTGEHSDASNLILAFHGLLERVEMASENDANINAMAKNIQWLYSLMYSREKMFDHLKQFLAVS